jgi:hypothetical protein
VTPEELAWVAGVYEGEGTIVVKSYPLANGSFARAARVIITMTDRDVVERVHKILGFGVLLKPHGPYVNGGMTKPRHTLSIERKEWAQAFIAMVWPWLGERRRAQAKAVLAAVTQSWEARLGA